MSDYRFDGIDVLQRKRDIEGEIGEQFTALAMLHKPVGQPQTPTLAGNGGFRRGWPFLPSRLSISAVSSPQI